MPPAMRPAYADLFSGHRTVGYAPRVRSVVVLNLVLAFAATALAGEPPAAGERHWLIEESLAVERLAPGVWLHVSYREVEGWGRVGANGLLVVGDGEAALLDTPWTGEQTEALFDYSRTVLGAPITAVVPTHSHGDCTGGLAVAHRLGAHSYALEKTAEVLREKGQEPPDTVFDDRMELEVGGRAVDLAHLGPGHTVDNIVAWLPDRRILFGGCLVKSARSRSAGYIAEADLAAWPKTLDRLEAEYPEASLIVPGHGAPGAWETVERTREIVADAAGRSRDHQER